VPLGNDCGTIAKANTHNEQQQLQLVEENTTVSFTQLLRAALTTPADWLLLGAVACTAIAAAAVNLLTPRLIGRLVNLLSDSIRQTTAAAVASSSSSMLLSALRGPALSLLALFGAQGSLTFVYIYLVAVLGERVAGRLRCRLYQSLIEQDMPFHDTNRSGELVARLTNDISEFKHAFKQTVSQGLKSVSQVVGSAVQLFQLSPQLTGALLITAPLLYGCGNLYGAYLRQLSASAKSREGQAAAIAGESLSNIKTVRSFASEQYEVDRYKQAVGGASEASERLAFHIGLFQGFTNFSIGSMVLTVLYFGGRMVVGGEMTGGDLMTYLISVQGAQKSLALVGLLFAQTIKSVSAFSRIQEFMDRQPTIPVRGGQPVDREFLQSADIEFRNIRFAYPSRPDQTVLDGFSLRIPRGKVIALCGASGSGKSTIAALLERFYDINSGSGGEILIGGKPIAQFDPSTLRRSIGYINQEPVLFGTSILENVRYARPGASIDQVRNVLRMANAETFVDQFPDGLYTTVGERGAMLSGGQKQRISIARALLKEPAVLILDEATSALDAHSEVSDNRYYYFLLKKTFNSPSFKKLWTGP
jgi:ATP-binding cassette subfamily B (MDR/TAP) protein 8